jgi:hypothetical protein
VPNVPSLTTSADANCTVAMIAQDAIPPADNQLTLIIAVVVAIVRLFVFVFVFYFCFHQIYFYLWSEIRF